MQAPFIRSLAITIPILAFLAADPAASADWITVDHCEPVERDGKMYDEVTFTVHNLSKDTIVSTISARRFSDRTDASGVPLTVQSLPPKGASLDGDAWIASTAGPDEEWRLTPPGAEDGFWMCPYFMQGGCVGPGESRSGFRALVRGPVRDFEVRLALYMQPVARVRIWLDRSAVSTGKRPASKSPPGKGSS